MSEETKKINKQKFNWKKISIYSSYEEANNKSEELKSSGTEYTKIRRCGPKGTKFKLLKGEKLKEKKKDG